MTVIVDSRRLPLTRRAGARRPLPAGGRGEENNGAPMDYAASDLTPRERYKVLTSFILPRPIAWVTSVGPTGVVNAAPFSFFNAFCEDPPLCMFAANRKPNGEDKD